MYRIMSIEYEKTKLLIGDIILIYSPTNSEYHQNKYLIEYLDNRLIKLLGEEEEKILTLDDRGYINDLSIVKIDIIYRNSELGYVRQNNLNIDNWINIFLGGEVPQIIVALIVDIEEDMIKLKTHPQNEYLYIDFGYKGVPEEFNILKIEIRDPPKDDIIKDSNGISGIKDEEIDLEEVQDNDLNEEVSNSNLEEGEIEDSNNATMQNIEDE